jgi:hypothetical protein
VDSNWNNELMGKIEDLYFENATVYTCPDELE